MIILYNWFPSGYRNFVVAIWAASQQLCPLIFSIIAEANGPGRNYIIATNKIVKLNRRLRNLQPIPCFVLAGTYLIMAFICKKYFYHHPVHIGVVVECKERSSGFFLDAHRTRTFGGTGTSGAPDYNISKTTKQSVSLIDAIRFLP